MNNKSNNDKDNELKRKLLDIEKTCTNDKTGTAKNRQLLMHHGQMLWESVDSIDAAKKNIEHIIDRTNLTFHTILIMNWILIAIGVSMFVAALYSAVGLQRWDITGVLSLTGFGDIYTVFKFSMNRVQRSLGDQVHVQTASYGYMKQIMKFDEHFKSDAEMDEIKMINAEIRKATLFSMELIRDFTEIGKPLKKESWMRARERAYHLRYGKLDFPSKVYVGQTITASGTIRNTGDEPINLKSIVIAVRPPFGTVNSGPFMFDFWIFPAHTLDPGESHPVTKIKCIRDSARREGEKEKIKEEYFGPGWFAFIACQTEDGEWHNDPNKTFFELLKKKQ